MSHLIEGRDVRLEASPGHARVCSLTQHILQSPNLPVREHGQIKFPIISKIGYVMKSSGKRTIALQDGQSRPSCLDRFGLLSCRMVPVREGGQLKHSSGLLNCIEAVQG